MGSAMAPKKLWSKYWKIVFGYIIMYGLFILIIIYSWASHPDDSSLFTIIGLIAFTSFFASAAFVAIYFCTKNIRTRFSDSGIEQPRFGGIDRILWGEVEEMMLISGQRIAICGYGKRIIFRWDFFKREELGQYLEDHLKHIQNTDLQTAEPLRDTMPARLKEKAVRLRKKWFKFWLITVFLTIVNLVLVVFGYGEFSILKDPFSPWGCFVSVVAIVSIYKIYELTISIRTRFSDVDIEQPRILGATKIRWDEVESIVDINEARVCIRGHGKKILVGWESFDEVELRSYIHKHWKKPEAEKCHLP